MQTKNILITIITILILSSLFIWFNIKKKVARSAIPNIVTVGTNAEYPPFTFIKDDKTAGFDIDLTTEIFKRMNQRFEIKDMSWSTLVPSLQLGRIQVIAAGMTPTPQKAKNVFFTRPYLKGDPLVIISLAKNPPIKTVAQLTGKTVIVNDGYTADRYMSKIKGLNLQRLQSPVQGFLSLNSGRADAYVIAKCAATPFLEKFGRVKFNIIEIPGTEEIYALAVSKQYPKLLDKIQKILDIIKKDGTLQELKNKWKIKC